ncbi:MAG: primosomal protein N' [Bacteroidales bacterium]|nr:primosomal protein N' [Bacteroidales bacterium]
MYRRYAEVIVPVSLPVLYTYAIPDTFFLQCVPGVRVVIPLGKSKLYSAIVRSVSDTCPQNCEIKEIIEVLDQKPIINAIQLRFWDWIASYYLCSLGEVYRAAVPSSLKLESETVLYRTAKPMDLALLKPKEAMFLGVFDDKHQEIELIKAAKMAGQKNVISIVRNLIGMGYLVADKVIEEKYKPRTEKYISLSDQITTEDQLREIFDLLEKKSPKQLEALMFYFQNSGVRLANNVVTEYGALRKSDMLKDPRVSPSSLSTLVTKKIFTEYEQETSRIEQYSGDLELYHDLTEYQQDALDRITNFFNDKTTVLLHGVTGCGKTEIYIKLIDRYLQQGKQVLYLLPEIVLTSQIIRRLQKVFGDEVAIYHSKISDGGRAELWHEIGQNGNNKLRLVVGVRSALFLPFSNLGLVIVDEEHDSSYKQQDPAPRYNARDCAIVLAGLHGAKVLLGSATPAVESYYNALGGKYGLVEINRRYSDAGLPEVHIVNTLDAAKKNQMRSLFSTFMLNEVHKTMQNGRQAVLFRNRRGFSPYVECASCGWVPVCDNCDVCLTYHKRENKLVCHHCGFAMDMPHSCKSCGDANIATKGFGTEKIEDEIKIFFPDARIARLDADVAASRRRYERVIYEFENGLIDIIAGTQMISKGFDFKDLQLAGVLNADSLINFPDFRAEERAFQMLCQVSGRTGRADVRGKVLIQTSQPGHPVFKDVVTGDYKSFYRRVSAERSMFAYPPYTRLIKLQLKHKDSLFLDDCALNLAAKLRKFFGDGVLGPEYPLISRLQNLYIKEILLKISRNHYGIQAKNCILASIGQLRAEVTKSGLIVALNVDPQ